MSLALDFLKEYLSRSDVTQADYAKACGIDPSLFSQLKSGDVSVSSKNLPKLLRGLHTAKDRLDFLTSYLRDQVPNEYANMVAIQIGTGGESAWQVAESTDDSQLEPQALLAFAALPSRTYRLRIIRFLQTLRTDAKLRDLFGRTMAYLEEEQGCGLSQDSLRASDPLPIAREQELVDKTLAREQSRKDRAARKSPRAPKQAARE